jgi:hypothetical protein
VKAMCVSVSDVEARSVDHYLRKILYIKVKRTILSFKGRLNERIFQ